MDLLLKDLEQDALETELRIRLLQFHPEVANNRIAEIKQSEPKPFVDDRGRTVRLHKYPHFGTAREVYSQQNAKWYHEAWVE